MKKILIFCLLCILIIVKVNAQNDVFARTVYTFKTFYLSGVSVDSILLDTNLVNATHRKLASSLAIKKYVDNIITNVPLGNELEGNDEVVSKDSSILFEDVVEQIRDSIWHTAYTFEEIAATNARVGDRILYKPNGTTYIVQADEVPYFTTDQEYVISQVSGNYAVADLSTKRKFDNKEDLKNKVHFCSIKDGEIIEMNGVEYEVYYHPKVFYNDTQTSHVQDAVVDGFFVDTIQVYLPNKNLVFYSNQVSNVTRTFTDGIYSPYIWLNGNAGLIPQNVTDAPDGTMTAERLYGFNSTASNQLQIFGNKLPVQIGDTLTFSMWARGTETTGGVEGIYSGGAFGTTFPGSPNIAFNLDGEWHQYGITFPVTSIPVNNSIFFGVFNNFANSDTLDVADFYIGKGTKAETQRSSWYRSNYLDRIYLYRTGLIENGVMDLSKVYGDVGNINNLKQGDHAKFINSAINYCAEGNRCNKVVLPLMSFYCKTPIVPKRGVRLVGANPASRVYGASNPTGAVMTTLQFALTDKTDYAIKVERYGALDVIDASGVSNLLIQVTDTLAGYIKTTEIAGCTFSNLSSEILTTSGNTGSVDSAAMWINTEVSSDNHYNNFDHIYFGGNADDTTPFGLIYEGGVGNVWNNCSFAADVSIWVSGGDFAGEFISVEDGNTGIYTTGGNTVINELYTESSAANGGSTIKMEGGRLYLENTTLQTLASTDTLLNLISGKSFELHNSAIIVEGRKFIGEGFDGIDFINVGSVTELRHYLNLSERQRAFVKIKGNYDYFDNSLAIFSQLDGRTRVDNMLIRKSNLENLTLSDTIKTSNVVLKGGKENLTNKSSDIPTGTSTYHKVIQDVLTDTLGSADADMIVMIGTGPSEFVQDKAVVEAYEIGEPYTISMDLKGISSATPITQIAARLGTGGPTVNFIVNSSNWKRYEKTVFATVSNTNFNIRVNTPTDLDTIGIANINVQKGYHATSRINTTTTGILSGGNPEFTIESGDTIIFDGNVQFNDHVIVPDEAYSSSWDLSYEAPTKNAIWDKLETKPVFGQMNFEDSTYVINPSGVTHVTNDANNLFTVVGDEGVIVIGGDSCILSYDGLTIVNFSLALSSAGGVYKIGLSINDVAINNLSSTITLAGDIQPVAINYSFIAAGASTPQVLKPTIIQVSGADPTLVDGSFSVYRILH